MKILLKAMGISIVSMLPLLSIFVLALPAEPQHKEPVMICKGDSIKPLVRSYDGVLYRVDVCAVTSSPEGDIFRYEALDK